MPATRGSNKTRSPVVVKVEPGCEGETAVDSTTTTTLPYVKEEKTSSFNSNVDVCYFDTVKGVDEEDPDQGDEREGDDDGDEDYEEEDGDSSSNRKTKKSKKGIVDHSNNNTLLSTHSATNKADLSELEQRRLENIRRNEEYLKSMGFDSLERSNTNSSSGSNTELKKKRSVRSSNKRSIGGEGEEGDASGYMEPVRRSRRLSKQPGEAGESGEGGEDSQFIDLDGVVPSSSARKAAREQYILEIDPDADIGREKITAPMLKSYIESKNPEHLELISNEVTIPTQY